MALSRRIRNGYYETLYIQCLCYWCFRCQNPQYHLEIADPYSTDEVYLKIVLRRTDKNGVKGSKGGARDIHTPTNPHGTPAQGSGHLNVHGHDSSKKEAFVGLVIAKADCLVEDITKAKKKQPRQNRFGEVEMRMCGVLRSF